MACNHPSDSLLIDQIPMWVFNLAFDFGMQTQSAAAACKQHEPAANGKLKTSAKLSAGTGFSSLSELFLGHYEQEKQH